MPDQLEEGPHVHQPCSRCGLVEAEQDGLCPECATQVRDEATAQRQEPDSETAEIERP